VSNAERQARHRARQAQARAQGQADGASILAAVATLTRAVEALAGEVHAMRTAGGYRADSGGKALRGVTSRGPNRAESLRNGEAAGARAWEYAPPPPTGVGGGAGSNDDDAHTVLVSLIRPGSVGSVRDALGAIGRDLSLDRITAALVTLQGRGLVHRTPGEGPAPDVWEAVPDPAELVDAVHHAARHPEPGPPMTIECQAYSAHSTLGHRWDAVAGVFRCYVCHPEGRPDHVPQANPTGLGGTPQLQEVH
jgi:hypothetical protein